MTDADTHSRAPPHAWARPTSAERAARYEPPRHGRPVLYLDESERQLNTIRHVIWLDPWPREKETSTCAAGRALPQLGVVHTRHSSQQLWWALGVSSEDQSGREVLPAGSRCEPATIRVNPRSYGGRSLHRSLHC